jgi:hypothetical protein
MSAAQTRAARRKNIQRYGNARKARSVGEAMAEERIKAARAAAAKKK